MKNLIYSIFILAGCLCNSSCQKEIILPEGSYTIEITQGEAWNHDFPLFLGIKTKNQPQFAIWLEDTAGNYLETLYVTEKIATEGWIANKGNRRKEALPHWCHQRGISYDDGLLLPTKEDPIVDGISGATPKEASDLKVNFTTEEQYLVIKAEFNHSTDFNEFFPEDAEEGNDNYSGGNMGGGQPAIVYAVILNTLSQSAISHSNQKNASSSSTAMELIGYSCPDGSDGELRTDFEKLSSALEIVESIVIKINQTE